MILSEVPVSEFDGFRAHVLNREKERAARKQKGLKPWEMSEFRLSVDEQALCRFHPTGEQPYVRKYHWPEGTGPKTCTAEMALFSGKCCYCHYDTDHKTNEQRKLEEARSKKEQYKKVQSRLNQQSRSMMQVTDFRYYHISASSTGEGKDVIVCNVEGPDGDPDRCEQCADEDEATKARLFGGARRWELKDDHLGQIFAAHQRLKKICIFQHEDGSLCEQEAYVIELNCRECGHNLEDPEKVRRMPTKEIEAKSKKDVVCPNCTSKDSPTQVFACRGGEHEAKPGSIFDKSVRVMCSGEMKETWDKKKYEDKVFTFDTNCEIFETAEETLQAWGFEDEEIKKILAPIDFSWTFRPEWINPNDHKEDEEYVNAVLDAQAEAIKKVNPWGTGPAGGFKGGGGARSFRRV